jgi:DNA-binding MarR family transcriptional regulator
VRDISQTEIRELAEFRHQLRRFLHFSEEAAKSAGIEPQQHQLMLAVKALEPESAGIGYLAQRLLLRHHSVVGLIDRLEQAGLVKRVRSIEDRRSAQIKLTPKGSTILKKLSVHHRRELQTAMPELLESLAAILRETEPHS